MKCTVTVTGSQITAVHYKACSPPLPPQRLKFPDDVEIVQLAHHARSKHYLALSSFKKVYAWGSGDNGQLGLGESK